MKFKTKKKARFCTALFFIASLAYLGIYSSQDVATTENSEPGNRIFSRSLNEPDFCVIASYFNPASYTSRYVLYKRFEQHMSRFKVRLITIELAINNHTFQVTNPQNPNHIQMRTNDVLWYKENLINIAFRRKYLECKYIAWVDVEVEFFNQNWVDETVRALESFKVVQLFEVVRILGQDSEVIEAHVGYGVCHKNSKRMLYTRRELKFLCSCKIKPTCKTGFGWAIKTDTLVRINGLFDLAIVGDGDAIISSGFSGISFNKKVKSQHLLDKVVSWQNVSYRFVKQRIGHIKGAINHLWHGNRQDRSYTSRRYILEFYNPKTDVYYDNDGLIHLTKIGMAKYSFVIKDYFHQRREDGNNTLSNS